MSTQPADARACANAAKVTHVAGLQAPAADITAAADVRINHDGADGQAVESGE
jgi:hypothetical protein